MTIIISSVIASLLLSSQLSTSHAATKAGPKCSKVGSKSVVGAKTFTCIKSGNKLVWDKGNKAMQPESCMCSSLGMCVPVAR